jgi:pimeloyl-ACP methyl ester carboxylesterase
MNRIVLANDADSAFDGASGLDAASRLNEIAIPAVVGCGDLDVPMKIDRSRELAGALPRGAFHGLAGRAHLPYLEDPAAVAALITSSARRPPGGSRC